MDRITTFLKFIEAAPNEAFPRYGLAMEYQAQGRREAARDAFEGLIETCPDYLPAYLMYGNTLVALEATDEAAAVYRRGIALASECGDGHTRGELEAALAEIA